MSEKHCDSCSVLVLPVHAHLHNSLLITHHSSLITHHVITHHSLLITHHSLLITTHSYLSATSGSTFVARRAGM